MNYQKKKERDELVSLLWKLKNAVKGCQEGWHENNPSSRFRALLNDDSYRSSFIDRATNSRCSEIRYVALKAKTLDVKGSLHEKLLA